MEYSDFPERQVLSSLDGDSDAIVHFLQELIQAKPVNPPGDEWRAAELIKPYLSDLGFEIEVLADVDGRPNLVARLAGGDGPTLLSTAHLDVVPIQDEEAWPVDPFAAEIVDGKLYGRGACDHKSPIVAMLYAVKAIQEQNLELGGDLLFIFDVNEERGGEHGMEYVVKNTDIEADMGIYACTTGLTDEAAAYFDKQSAYNIYRSNFGNQVYTVTVDGLIKHPMAPAETESAGERVSKLLPEIQAYCDDICTRESGLVDSLEANITTIDCDGWEARAAPKMEVHVHRYYTVEEDPGDVFAEFQDRVQAAAAAEGISDAVTTSLTSDMPPIEVPADHELIEAARKSMETVKGVEPTVTGIPAQTGITWMVQQFDIPMILFGFGNVDLHHAEPEWIEPDDVVDTAKSYALTYLDVLGHEEGSIEE